MRALRAERRAGRVGDLLVLVEHPPVVTVGVEGDDGSAAASGLPVVSVERGGKSTYHGPGQLVGYPIVDLRPGGCDVRGFVHATESLVIDTLAGFAIRGEHLSGRRGVWVDSRRKIASIGIAVQDWVTFHGFALNVDMDLSPFERIHPCGFEGRVMTSMALELGRPVPLTDVKALLTRLWLAPPKAPPRGNIPAVPA
jgi:lipoate-protein ligase B